jgi:hypothetical protein
MGRLERDIMLDVEASRAIRQAEVGASKTMIERTQQRFDIKPERLAGDTAYGSGANLKWLVKDKDITPHIPVIDKSKREDGTFSREDLRLSSMRSWLARPMVVSRSPCVRVRISGSCAHAAGQERFRLFHRQRRCAGQLRALLRFFVCGGFGAAHCEPRTTR